MTNKLYALAGQINIIIHDHFIIGGVNEVTFKNLVLLEAPIPNF